MIAWVVYSKTYGYFKRDPGKSLYWSEKDFVPSLDKAHKWNKRELALDKATSLAQGIKDKNSNLTTPTDVEVLEIEVTVVIVSREPLSDTTSKRVAELLPMVQRISALDAEETEALPLKEWKAYKRAREELRYLSALD